MRVIVQPFLSTEDMELTGSDGAMADLAGAVMLMMMRWEVWGDLGGQI
jgi:hypothetical protein